MPMVTRFSAAKVALQYKEEEGKNGNYHQYFSAAEIESTSASKHQVCCTAFLKAGVNAFDVYTSSLFSVLVDRRRKGPKYFSSSRVQCFCGQFQCEL